MAAVRLLYLALRSALSPLAEHHRSGSSSSWLPQKRASSTLKNGPHIVTSWCFIVNY